MKSCFFIFKENKTVGFYHRSLWLFLFALILCASCGSHKKIIEEDVVSHEIIVKKDKNKDKKGGNKKSSGEKIADEAITWIGTPYVYAMQNKGRGTDCSGLTMVIYEQVAGIKIPRNSAKQAEFCETIRQKDIEPGDLVFFATGKDPKKVSHVGVMLDKNRFVHASSSRGVVISEMTTAYYRNHFIKFGRVPR